MLSAFQIIAGPLDNITGRGSLSVSEKYASYARNFGITIDISEFAEAINERKEIDGKTLMMKDLYADLDVIFGFLNRYGWNFVAHSVIKEIKLTVTSYPHLSHTTILVRHGAVTDFPRYLYQACDPYRHAPLFWEPRTPKGFFFKPGVRNASWNNLSFSQILECDANRDKFLADFASDKGQDSAAEDRAQIFLHFSNPAKVEANKKALAVSPELRNRFYAVVIMTSDTLAGGIGFWKDLYGFSPQELAAIKDQVLDPVKHLGIRCEFANNNPSKLHRQRLTVYTALSFPPGALQYVGIRRIVFTDKPPAREECFKLNTLTINDSQAHLVIETFMEQICRKRLTGNAKQKKEQTARIASAFRAFVENPQGAVARTRGDTAFRQDLATALDAVSSEFPKSTFGAYKNLVLEYMDEEKAMSAFAASGIACRALTASDTGVEGDSPSDEEVANARRAIAIHCSTLPDETLKATKVRKIIIVKGLRADGHGRQEYLKGDTLYIESYNRDMGRAAKRQISENAPVVAAPAPDKTGGVLSISTEATKTAYNPFPFPQEILNFKALEDSGGVVLKPGVTHRRFHLENPFGDGPLRVNYLIIDWKHVSKTFTMELGYSGARRRRPSSMLDERSDVFAVVNGGYHKLEDPSTPWNSTKNGGKLTPGVNPGGDTALAFNRHGMPIITKYTQEILDQYDNCLSCDGNNERDMSRRNADPAARRKSFAPRSFVGQNTNGVTVVCVVDGRAGDSSGIAFVEQWELARPFGVQRIVNLDGGGSSVMAIRDADGNPKIMNHPSDGRTAMTPGSERRVCDYIMFIDEP